MRCRRVARAGLLAAALAIGAGAFVTPPVLAAPSATSSVVTGDDPVARLAARALDAWHTAQTGDRHARSEFERLRDIVATEAAHRVGVDAAAVRAAWRSADAAHQVALVAALTQLGTPYRTNSRMPGQGFDCSGLTSWAWEQAGVTIFHQSRTQIREALPETRETAQAGDLVYYPGHVMLWLGVGDAIIHAPFRGRPVEVALLATRRSKTVRFGNPIQV